jgi:hypothetical protein
MAAQKSGLIHASSTVASDEAAVAGGEGEEQVARGVLAGAPGASHTETGPLCEALALVRQERRVGGEDDDDGATLAAGAGGCRGFDVGGHFVEADLATDGHAVDGQPLTPAVVRLHERTDREAALLRRHAPRGRADAALEAMADGARATAHVAFRDRSAGGGRQRRLEVLGSHVLAVDVVEPAIPGLGHDR